MPPSTMETYMVELNDIMNWMSFGLITKMRKKLTPDTNDVQTCDMASMPIPMIVTPRSDIIQSHKRSSMSSDTIPKTRTMRRSPGSKRYSCPIVNHPDIESPKKVMAHCFSYSKKLIPHNLRKRHHSEDRGSRISSSSPTLVPPKKKHTNTRHKHSSSIRKEVIPDDLVVPEDISKPASIISNTNPNFRIVFDNHLVPGVPSQDGSSSKSVITRSR